MAVEVITKGDLENFGTRLLKDIENLLEINKNKKWLKTGEVLELLGMSDTTLHTLRSKGIIPFKKLGSIYYYNVDELDAAIKNL